MTFDAKTYNREVTRLLLAAPSSGAAIKSAFLLLKASHRQLSIALLSHLTRMPSKGNMSDVLQGRRLLARKYLPALAHALRLSALGQAILAALLDRDRAKSPEERGAIERRLRKVREQIDAERFAGETHLGLHQSFALHVKADRYAHVLAHLRFLLAEETCQLEAAAGDLLVTFQLQIVPVSTDLS